MPRGWCSPRNVCFLNQWVKLSTWSHTYQPHLGFALQPSHGALRPCFTWELSSLPDEHVQPHSSSSCRSGFVSLTPWERSPCKCDRLVLFLALLGDPEKISFFFFFPCSFHSFLFFFFFTQTCLSLGWDTSVQMQMADANWNDMRKQQNHLFKKILALCIKYSCL